MGTSPTLSASVVGVTSDRASISVTAEFSEILRSFAIFQKRSDLPQNEKYQVRWKLGDIVSFHKSCEIEQFTTLGHGNTLFSAGSFGSIISTFPINTVIGRFCSIGHGGTMRGYRHPIDAVSMSSAVFNRNREFVNAYFHAAGMPVQSAGVFNAVRTPQPQTKPLHIGHDVWIGTDVLFSGGISIGTGAVIASKSVLTKSVPPFAIVGGNPAKVIKYRFPDTLQRELLSTEWWNYELSDLHQLGLANPSVFIENLERERTSLSRYEPKKFKPWELFIERMKVALVGLGLVALSPVMETEFGGRDSDRDDSRTTYFGIASGSIIAA